MNGMFGCQGEFNPALFQVIADGYFSAESVTSPDDIHGGKVIGICLNQDRNIQFGKFEGFCNSFFVPKIWQHNQHANNLIPVFPE